ncbi:MAG: hypothetical protein L6Q97_08060 [Thermoanaerobaculia bacterium]|nr:hypothetical protein [Thermoanaerobaculia bacterium]
MSTDERLRSRRTMRNPLLLLGFVMTFIYLGLGAWLLIDKSFLPGIPADFRNIFAVMLLVYGGYRGWRLYADYF